MCNFKVLLLNFSSYISPLSRINISFCEVTRINIQSTPAKTIHSNFAWFSRLFFLFFFFLFILAVNLNLLPSVAAVDADECTQYTKLTSAYRSITYYDFTVERCDKQLQLGWYRFTEQAGRMMPTKCVAKFHCGAYGPGWLDGDHPLPQDGRVNRRVCFHLEGECCKEWVFINVRNCGNFMVYQLKPPPKCPLRYCGDAVKETSSSIVEGTFLKLVE